MPPPKYPIKSSLIDPNGGYSTGQSGVHPASGISKTGYSPSPPGVYPTKSNLSAQGSGGYTPSPPGTYPTPPGGYGSPSPAPPPTVPGSAWTQQPTDYSSLYNAARNSPGYQQALAAANAQGTSLGADRQQAIQQALIQFGEIPPGFLDKFGDVTDTTRSLANQNTSSGISIVARMRQAQQDAQRSLINGLQARGLRRSGARGYGLRRGQLTYDQARQDAIDRLLQGTNSAYSNFTNAFNQNQSGLGTALQNAINGLAPSWTAPPPTYAAPPGGYGGGNPLFPTQSQDPNINPIFFWK